MASSTRRRELLDVAPGPLVAAANGLGRDGYSAGARRTGSSGRTPDLDEARVAAGSGGVGERVMEHIEGAFALGDVDGEALASLPVGYGDDHATVALAPEQPDVDAVMRTVVELAEVIGHGPEKVPASACRGNTGAPANRLGVVPTYLPWLARRLGDARRSTHGQERIAASPYQEPPQRNDETRAGALIRASAAPFDRSLNSVTVKCDNACSR
jgi:hypothetical protein